MDRHPSGRERLHNPNYPPPLHSYAPPVARPPTQPAADPFARSRRDPFLSATASDKRDHHLSHTMYPPNGASRIETLQPAPAPPQSPFHGFGPTFGGQSRRSSISGGYTPTSREPPPPPPPLLAGLNRQMPPPAPSPKDSPSTAYPRGSLPNPSSFSTGRDGLVHGLGHRPSGSMSLSSIMGSDQGIAPKGPPMRAPFGTRTPQHSSGPFVQPTSPSYDRRPGFFGELTNETRSRTPEKRSDSHFIPPFARTGLAISPTGHPSQMTGPEQADRGGNKSTQPQLQTSPSGSALPPRPFSQPTGPGFLAHEQRYRPPAHDMNQPRSHGSGNGMLDPRFREPPANGQSREQFDQLERTRDRSVSDADSRKNGSLLFQPFAKPPPEQSHNGNLGMQPNESTSFMPRHNYHDRPTQSEGPRLHEYTKPPELSRYRRSPPMSQIDKGPAPPYHGFGPVYTSAFMPQEASGPGRTFDRPELASFTSSNSNTDGIPAGGRRTPVIDGHLRRSIEDTHAHHRSFLSGLDQDRLRRLDRGSPLPQAVQGAQSQPAGSNRDPGIKSEFGRMFSGLGSGVGSTPVPSASYALPSSAPRSPIADHMDLDRVGRNTPDGPRPTAGATRGGRKGSKRTHDEEIRMGSDSGDGRGTPLGSGRGGKRSKYALPAHHHHHHPPTLHHHHHRKAEEEPAPQPSSQSTNGSPFASFKFPGSSSHPPVNSAPSPVPHHHHHHHPPHHHHHPPKTSPTTSQPLPLRLPTTTILTKPLLQSVSHLPRQHLGSHLYTPTVHLPATASTTIDSPRTYTTSPNPLPDFSGKENCTFTIRVSRFYLTHEARQSICADRQLWGTDVYTDDSDPVAAAVHSGWIRGAWGPNVDVSLLSLDANQAGTSHTVDSVEEPTKSSRKKMNGAPSRPASASKNDARNTSKRLVAPPTTGPTDPPENSDMHLTLLILPPLERYGSSVWHGIKSRAWGGNHDGMSFKIEHVEFVDEGFEGRYEERGTAAKRRRVKESAGNGSGLLARDLTRAVLTGSLLKSGVGLAGFGRKSAAAAIWRSPGIARPMSTRIAQVAA